MKSFSLFIFAFIVHQSNGLKTISHADYYRFPPIAHLDRYSTCVMEDGGVYCRAHADLYVDEPNELFTAMEKYSSSSPRHFNYTKIKYGYCLTRKCKKYYSGNSTSELHASMEACLNDIMTKEYNMKARVTKIDCYQNKEKRTTFDEVDKIAVMVIAFLVFLCIVGTACDVCSEKKNSWLLCFSLRANWNRLKAPWPTDAKSQQMRGLNGLRVITSLLIVLSHVMIPRMGALENPEFIEDFMEDWNQQSLLHMHIVMQTFFFLSGLLMAYSMQNTAEKVQITWKSYPKAVFLRWVRLIPVSAATLMMTATLARFAPIGPLWQELVGKESLHCRKNWLYHILGINNLIDDDYCSPHTWSNACDFQMHVIGGAILILSPNKTIRNFAIWALFIASVITLGVVTYTNDLSGGFIVKPEMGRMIDVFLADPMYKYFYKRAHTNLPCFVLGIMLGLKIHEWQKKPITEADSKKYQKYVNLYWCIFPIMLLVAAVNGIVIIREDPAPLWIRVAIGMLQKPLWGLLLVFLTIGLVFKIERVPIYRGVLDSGLWIPLSKLTYCVYNIHMLFLRVMGGENSLLNHLCNAELAVALCGVATISYLLALILWMLVEAPVNNLIRLMFPEKRTAIACADIIKDVTDTSETKKQS